MVLLENCVTVVSRGGRNGNVKPTYIEVKRWMGIPANSFYFTTNIPTFIRFIWTPTIKHFHCAKSIIYKLYVTNYFENKQEILNLVKPHYKPLNNFVFSIIGTYHSFICWCDVCFLFCHMTNFVFSSCMWPFLYVT